MLDGLPLDRLQRDGVPVGRFWQNVQERYATLYGSRVLTDFKTRSDKGTKRPHAGSTRNGKETMTTVKRQRQAVVSLRPPLPLGDAAATNVFGHNAMSRQHLLQLCVQEESTKFKDLVLRAQKQAKMETQTS